MLMKLKQDAAASFGIVNQTLGDINSKWYNKVAQMLNEIGMKQNALEAQLKQKMELIEKYERAHPDLKISIESKRKKAQAANTKVPPTAPKITVSTPQPKRK